MKTLFLVLKKKWYLKIASGEKSIEYRTFNEFWFTRLAGKSFTDIIFQLGYSKNAPRMRMPITAIDIGDDPDIPGECFRIHLDVNHIEYLIPLPFCQDSLFDRPE
jgi:hypothetical protein